MDAEARNLLMKQISMQEAVGGKIAVPLDKFFVGNDDLGSIGCNIGARQPAISEFHRTLARLQGQSGVMATVRHMAMNLLRSPKDKHSIKVRRTSAAWDTSYLEALLRQST